MYNPFRSPGHDDIIVTPTMEWRQEFALPCDGASGACFRYPLLELQKQDTDLGLWFYVIMHVFNKAGHVVTARTEAFTLPSMYPPAKAIIIDLDPNLNIDTSIPDVSIVDVDAHMSIQTLCAMWNEFTHHDDVKLEFGVGTSRGKDDAYPFTEITATNTHCVVSTAIPEKVNLFVSIRASCSGGSTISSTDGVIIYNANRIFEQLEVLDGPKCLIAEHLLGETTYAAEGIMTFSPPLAEGQIYTLHIVGIDLSGSEIDLQNFDAHIKNVNDDLRGYVDVVFQPYADMQELVLPPILNENASTATAEVYDCEDDVSLKIEITSLEAHWRGLPEHFTLEAAAVKLKCDYPLEKCMKFLSFYAISFGVEVKVSGLNLEESDTYYIAVRPCLNTICLGPKLSTGVSVDLRYDHDRVKITKSSITYSNTDCSRLNLAWEGLYPHVHISFYKWTVVARVGISETNSALLPWQKVLKENTAIFNVSFRA